MLTRTEPLSGQTINIWLGSADIRQFVGKYYLHIICQIVGKYAINVVESHDGISPEISKYLA